MEGTKLELETFWGISVNNMKSIPHTAGPMAFWWTKVNLFVMFVKDCLFIELLCFVIGDSIGIAECWGGELNGFEL